jgi:uncharacterized DUF497 family protein
MVIYEWDEEKRQINIAKHGIDFLDADLVFESSTKITVDVSRSSDREVRYADFAEVKGCVLKLVYTVRNKVARCVSLRVASRKERSLYHEAKARSSFKSKT